MTGSNTWNGEGAWYENFSNGNQSVVSWYYDQGEYRVRAIRQVAGPR
jgi:hypothetical protein